MRDLSEYLTADSTVVATFRYYKNKYSEWVSR